MIEQDLTQESVIKEFTFRTIENKLIINAHIKDATYQSEPIQSTTQKTIEEYQTLLNRHEYRELTAHFQTIRFVSHDVQFTLINRDLIQLNNLKKEMKEKHDKIHINMLQNEPNHKQQEPQTLRDKIAYLENNIRQKFTQSNYKPRIDKRQRIYGLKELQDEVFPYLFVRFSKLWKIYLHENQITDELLSTIIEHADKFKNLTSIFLSNNQITDQGLNTLAEHADRFKNLKQIYLNKNPITDEGLTILAEHADKFKNLQTIFLNENQLTDHGLKALVKHADNLKNMSTIFLSDNKITDQGLIALVERADKFRKMKEICLSKNKITDQGLMTLAENADKFNNLKDIFLGQNQITSEALRELAKQADKIDNNQNNIRITISYKNKRKKTWYFEQRPLILSWIEPVNFTRLQSLNIIKSKIVNAQSLAFLDMPNLQILKLEQNLISCLKALNKVHWPQLKQIKIDNNHYSMLEMNRAGLNYSEESEGLRLVINFMNPSILVKIQTRKIYNLADIRKQNEVISTIGMIRMLEKRFVTNLKLNEKH